MTIALLTVVAAVLCWPARPRPAARLPSPSQTASPDAASDGVRGPVLVAAVVAIAALPLAGAPWWMAAGLALAAVAGARAKVVDAPGLDEIPVTADLMAACLSAGAGLADALAASLVAAGPWLRVRGDDVVASLRAGDPPEAAWGGWLAEGRLAPMARACMRSSGSGSAVAAELTRLAGRLRAGQRAERQQRAARASVWIVLPLGTCFLPAFVAVGVVPLVISLVERLH